MRIRMRTESLRTQGRLTMAITEKDRDDFFKRLAAVRKVRSNDDEVPGEYVTEDGHEWSDEDIEMAIDFGF